MDLVSVLERMVEVRVDGLLGAAPPSLARLVDHLVALVDDGHSGAPADHRGSEVSATADSDLAQGEAAMAMGLSAFEAAERLRGLVDGAQLGALTRLHSSARAVFDSAAAQEWVGRTLFTVHEMVVLEVTAATGLGAGEVGSRLDLAIGSVARFRLSARCSRRRADHAASGLPPRRGHAPARRRGHRHGGPCGPGSHPRQFGPVRLALLCADAKGDPRGRRRARSDPCGGAEAYRRLRPDLRRRHRHTNHHQRCREDRSRHRPGGPRGPSRPRP